MRVTLDNTDKLVELQIGEAATGAPVVVMARVWEGHTENGIPCHAYIVRIAVDKNNDAAEFEHDLMETRPATAAIQALPSRMVI